MFNNILENSKIVLTVFLFVAIIMPVVMKLAKHVNALDMPNERKVHKHPMPRMGGVAIFLGFLLGYMLFCTQTIQMNSILIGSFILIIVGIADDINPLSPLVKFCGQIVSAIIVVYYGNIILQDLSAYGIYINFGIFAKPITILFIVAIINCVNLIDGLDGLAGGICSIFFITISIISNIMGVYYGLDASLTLIMLGATLGFLVYNFHPAKIFMGDSGSMFLGYMIAVISLLGYKNVTLTSFIVPVLILAIPILDTLFAIIRRLLKGQSFAKADKEHFHHQILKRAGNQTKTVLIIYLIQILFSLASIVYVLQNPNFGQVLYAIILAIILWLIIGTNIVFDRTELVTKIKRLLSRKRQNR
ncbi:MAG: undecaprenyl/decaprenyl-phosphate alpha-N-acetylglucosaminyl 1-phosphate transferase [Bacilli bacterium]|nr:undecaprenyl/decaprenyl-phosphate alpha-N-acetylglucosaminyl 1-phosphate transferase [Bacilli bacterium]